MYACIKVQGPYDQKERVISCRLAYGYKANCSTYWAGIYRTFLPVAGEGNARCDAACIYCFQRCKQCCTGAEKKHAGVYDPSPSSGYGRCTTETGIMNEKPNGANNGDANEKVKLKKTRVVFMSFPLFIFFLWYFPPCNQNCIAANQCVFFFAWTGRSGRIWLYSDTVCGKFADWHYWRRADQVLSLTLRRLMLLFVLLLLVFCQVPTPVNPSYLLPQRQELPRLLMYVIIRDDAAYSPKSSTKVRPLLPLLRICQTQRLG